MFCSQCGAKLPENSKFCHKCGNKILFNLKITEAKTEIPKDSQNKNEINFKEWGASHIMTEKESGTKIKPFSLFKVFKEVCSEVKDKKNPEKRAERERKEIEDDTLRGELFGRADKKIVDIILQGKNSDIDENEFAKIIDNEKELSGNIIDCFSFKINSAIENKDGILFVTSKGIAIIIQSRSTGSAIYAAAGLGAAGAIGAAIGAGFGGVKKTKNFSKSELGLIERCEKYSVSLVAKCYPSQGDYPDGVFFPYKYIDKIIYDLNNGCIQITTRIFSDEIIYINKENLADLVKIFK